MQPGSPTDPTATVHASCIAIDDIGVLIRGPSGSGKSDLCLRLIDGGAYLVADDRTTLTRASCGEAVIASPPEAIAGLLEVRGLGILKLPYRDNIQVRLLVKLSDESEIERLPADETEACLGIDLPVLRLVAFHASATAKVRLAVAHLCRDTPGTSPAAD